MLDMGHEVVAVDIRLGGLAACCRYPKFTAHRASVTDAKTKELLRDCDALVHLAAVVGATACEQQPQFAAKLMRDGTRQLLDWAGGKKVVYPMTDAGLDKPERSLYSQLKTEGEDMVLAAGGISLRLGSAFGWSPSMRDDLLLHWLVREALSGKPVKISQPDAKRTLVHVNDIVRATLKALYSSQRGVAHHVTLPAMSKRELAGIVGKHVDFSEGLRCGVLDRAGDKRRGRDRGVGEVLRDGRMIGQRRGPASESTKQKMKEARAKRADNKPASKLCKYCSRPFVTITRIYCSRKCYSADWHQRNLSRRFW
jgi:nucleoside-diphosphate-sugar epimerase